MLKGYSNEIIWMKNKRRGNMTLGSILWTYVGNGRFVAKFISNALIT